jgi:hypothetical protein
MTLLVIPADLWAYTFAIDGVRVLVPNTDNVVCDGVGFINIFISPGQNFEPFQSRQVPHGRAGLLGSVASDRDTATPVRLHATRSREKLSRALPDSTPQGLAQ